MLKLNDIYVSNDISMQTWEQSFGKIFNNRNLIDDDCLLPISQLEDIPIIMQAEVELAWKKRKNGKAPGLDSSYMNMLKLCAPYITARSYSIF
jgi:hypothetical protein